MAKRKGVRKRRRVVYLSRPYEATGFCNDCRSCELACSLQNAGAFNPGRSRIKVVSLATGIEIPVTCQQCEVPWCQKACLVNAIFQDRKQDIVGVDEKKYISCERCVGAFPYGIMLMDEDIQIQAVASASEALAMALDRYGKDATVGFFPYGKWILPKGLHD